jgi:hypothetical protein
MRRSTRDLLTRDRFGIDPRSFALRRRTAGRPIDRRPVARTESQHRTSATSRQAARALDPAVAGETCSGYSGRVGVAGGRADVRPGERIVLD